MRLAALTRVSKEFKSNLARLRKAKLQYGDCRLPPSKQSKLIADIKTAKGDLEQAIAKYAVLASADDETCRYIQLARDVLRDCNEMLKLLL